MAWNAERPGTDDEDEDKATTPRRSVIPPASLIPHPPAPSERPARAEKPDRSPVMMWAASRMAAEQIGRETADKKDDDEEDDEDEGEIVSTDAAQDKQSVNQEVIAEEPVESTYANPFLPPATPLVRPVGPTAEQTPLSEDERTISDELLQAATTPQTAAAMSGVRLGGEPLTTDSPRETADSAQEAPTYVEYQPAEPQPTRLEQLSPFSPAEKPPEEPVYTPPASGGSSRPPTPPSLPPHYSESSSAPEPIPVPTENWQAPQYYRPETGTAPGFTTEAPPVRSVANAAVRQYEAAARTQGRVEGAVVAGVIGYFLGRRSANKRAEKTIREIKKEAETGAATTAINHVEAMRQLRAENKGLRDGAPSPQTTAERPPIEYPAAPLTAEQPHYAASPNAPTESMPLTADGPSNNYRPPLFEAAAAMPAAALRAPEAPRPSQPVPEAVDNTPGAPTAEVNPFADKEQEQKPDHYVRSEWLNIGVDKEGHAIGQQEYGRAFREETKQEQAGTFRGQQDSGGASGGGAYTGPATTAGYQASQAIPSDQALTGQSLSVGGSSVDSQHHADAPKKQIVSSIANPWFWLMLVIIIAAFFASALI